MKKGVQHNNNKRQVKPFVVVGVIIIVAAVSVSLLVREKMIDRPDDVTINKNSSVKIPSHLLESFKKTDWSMADSTIEKAISGGPAKDGIPALENPSFVNLSQTSQSDEVQAIVVTDGDTVKAFPYNILIWHEIINDTVNGQPVAVTFCPLCGSAAVYERTLNGDETTFGVSGSLIESNMVMFDRDSETLWQQTSGKAIAGKHFGADLQRVEFQLLTFSEIRSKYPNAQVVSEDTGHNRDYQRNPYAGYETDESFYFAPSKTDERYPSKSIFVVFSVDETSVGIPWLSIKEDTPYATTVNDQIIRFEKVDGELNLLDSSEKTIPFYFEMWFSWAVQHQENGIVYDPSK